ncbi:MAG: DUF1848 domain-containing protein [Alphaproteobacteria bacterium]|nr:DUF1848 domain-containing protein [Alphaproteobacteria bacterium]
MIVSASYRTDIPAFYAGWLMARLAAGEARVRSPYGGQPTVVGLRPEAVDGFVFWTRNAAPMMRHWDRVRRVAPFYVQFTLTDYPRALEVGTLASAAALRQMRALARRFGPRVVVWRYDPIVLSSLTPADWHAANFARLARVLAGVVDEVVVSFVQPYRKTVRNLDAAARRHGFAWRDPDDDDKRALLARLVPAARMYGIRLTLCTQPDLQVPGAGEARCIDAARLSDLAGRPIAVREKGNRPGCRCAESRDIGAYDSCAQGCAYCYAVADRARAIVRLKRQDAAAPMLG